MQARFDYSPRLRRLGSGRQKAKRVPASLPEIGAVEGQGKLPDSARMKRYNLAQTMILENDVGVQSPGCARSLDVRNRTRFCTRATTGSKENPRAAPPSAAACAGQVPGVASHSRKARAHADERT